LSDMVTDSLLDPIEVEAERAVILEEIAMTEDDSSDAAHEAFGWQLFGDTPLGRPILGTVASIEPIAREQIREHYAGKYTPDNVVVAAAGRLDHDEVVEATKRCFGAALDSEAKPIPPRLPGPAGPEVGAGTGVRLISRPIEQANLVLGCAGLARTDDRRVALGVANAALGGGVCPRLVPGDQEEAGVAYLVYSGRYPQ